MERGRITYLLGFLPTYVLREILELKARGFRIDVLLPESGGTSDIWMRLISREELKEGITVSREISHRVIHCPSRLLVPFIIRKCLPVLARHPFRFLRFSLSSIRVRSFRFFLLGASLCGRIRHDTLLVHSHFARTTAFAGMWAARLLGKPFTVTAHAVDIFVPEREELVRFMFGEADSLLTISRFNREYIAERYGEGLREKVRVTHLGLDPASLPPARGEAGPVPLAVCTASGLGEKKGVPVLVEACRILASRDLRFRCRVIGADRNGEMLESYREETRQSGLAGVLEFVGAVTSDEVLREVAGADVFVLPSVTARNGDMDGIPVSLMESMAMGVPTISTRLSGIPELIDSGLNGLLVAPGDPVALAEAMELLMTRRDLAGRLGEGGMKKAREDFSVSGYVTRLLDCWSRLTDIG